MSPTKIRSGIHRLQNFNFTTASLNSTSNSSVPFQKCCKNDQLYDFHDRKCVYYDFVASLPNADPRPNPSKFQVHNGFPCLYPDYKYSENNSSWIQYFFHDGSIDLQLNNEKTRYHLKWGQYCLDVERGSISKFSPILITCDQLFPARSVQLGYLVLYLISLSLVFTNFSLHLAIPELRTKIKDKCFICYLASLMFWMIIYADAWGLNGISLLTKFVSINVALSLEFYSFMVTFSWLNVMCIHLWRTVSTINSISLRSFYIYALYALGLPLICRICFYIDRSISGLDKFSSRAMNDGPFSNPILLYVINVCSIQQIINIGIFVRVGYMIWNQKRRWNGNEESVRMKHYRQHKRMFSQLLRLFIIMDVEWIYLFITLYFGIRGKDNAISRFCFWVNLCPGYFIFIVYVCCNKQLISSVRKRFHKRTNEGATSFRLSRNSTSIWRTSQTPTIQE